MILIIIVERKNGKKSLERNSSELLVRKFSLESERLILADATERGLATVVRRLLSSRCVRRSIPFSGSGLSLSPQFFG